MVKRIKHIHDLKLQQQLLLQKQQLLEKSIKEDWNGLQHNLQPGNLIQDIFWGRNGKKKNGATNNDWLSAGISFIAKKIFSKG